MRDDEKRRLHHLGSFLLVDPPPAVSTNLLSTPRLKEFDHSILARRRELIKGLLIELLRGQDKGHREQKQSDLHGHSFVAATLAARPFTIRSKCNKYLKRKMKTESRADTNGGTSFAFVSSPSTFDTIVVDWRTP